MNTKSSLTRRRMLQGISTAAGLALAPGRFALGATGAEDVVVIGAGLAGLNATLLLQDAGYRVRLIEGSQRIGGRLYTAPDSEVPGHPEMGGSGIGQHYARILDMARRFDVKMEKSRPRTEPRPGDLIYHVRGQLIAMDDWTEHPLNPFKAPKLREMSLPYVQYSVLDAADNPLPIGELDAWQSGKHGDSDISVYEYLMRKGINPQAIKLGCGTNMSYGSSAFDLSVLMGFQSSNLIRTLYNGPNAFSGGGMAAAGGNQRVPEGMATGVKSEIVMGQQVRAIEADGGGVKLTTVDNQQFKAKYAICTLPFSALRHVALDPNPQSAQAQAIHELDYTPVFQVHFVPTSPYWEADSLPPSMWTDGAPGRFMALRNDPENPAKITSCLAFVNGEMARFLDRLPPEQAAQRVLSDLARMRPSTKGALKVVKVWSWNRSQLAGGAYAYWRPGQITKFSKQMRAPLSRIHFAGEHTAVVNRGMEGAMESGERAALEVMDRLG